MEHTNMLVALKATISHLAGPPPDNLWSDFSKGLRRRHLTKSEMFLKGGDNPKSVAFVASGLFRMFYLRRDGRELNKSFVADHDFIASFESLLSRDDNHLSIECLAPAEVLEFDFDFAYALYDNHMYWQRFGRLLAERLYVKKARREASLLMNSALERYELFLQDYGELSERVPDYHIASYLGVTPEALSRLKKSRSRS